MLTTTEIFKEYAKCLTSPIYAIETYLETFDKTQEGFVPFKLFPRQKEIIHAYEKHRFNLITKPIILEEGCWIGANASVSGGVTVGNHAVLSMGSTATKDLAPYTIYRGNPAIEVKKRVIS